MWGISTAKEKFLLKYVMFYANLAWVIVLLIGSRIHNVSPVLTVSNVVLVAVTVVCSQPSATGSS